MYDDGRTVSLSRRERPHLLFDAATGTRPLVLFTALTNWNDTYDKAFTFGQRIR